MGNEKLILENQFLILNVLGTILDIYLSDSVNKTNSAMHTADGQRRLISSQCEKTKFTLDGQNNTV